MENAKQTISGLEMALAIWHRRRWSALLVFVVLFGATFGVTRNLPSTYQSTATVLVERPQVPDRLSGSSGDTYVELETRLRTLSQQIQSRSRLSELITRLDLYPELRPRATPMMLVERMRQNIQLTFSGLLEPAFGVNPTFSFRISFRGHDPETVARVANALAALYVEENARTREQETAGTTEFLRAQLADAERKLRDQEGKVSAFTTLHNGELPEQQAANLAALGRLNEQIVVIMDRRNELTRRLTELPGYTMGDTDSARLAKLRQDLANLRTRDTDEHPDVVRMKQEIAELERHLAAAGGGGGAAAADPRTLIEVELKDLRIQEREVRRAIATYEQRVENAPVREQEFQQLSRDYGAAKELYQSLRQRYEDAQLAASMVRQHPQGEQFTILDPAVASSQPAAPHRFRLLLMGLMLSLGAALGVVFLVEMGDTSFHTVDDVRGFTGIPVLASIPPIVTEADTRRRRREFGLAALAAMVGVAIVVGATSYLARSNEVLASLLGTSGF